MVEYQSKYFGIVGVIGAIIWLLDYFRWFQKPQLYISKRYQPTRSYMRVLLLFVAFGGWYYLTLAMMAPRVPKGMTSSPQEINDIFFVVDTSNSMTAEDFTPNRLEVAKKNILNFIDLTPIDRIGIIVFSEKPFTLTPLTRDLEILKKSINENFTLSFLGGGTNIGDALSLATTRLAYSTSKNRVIILLTDGASNVGTMSPEQASLEAKKANIKIYSIGIGGDKNAKMPVYYNGSVKYQSIPGESYDFESLQMISKNTGGKSYIAADANSLRRVFNEVGALERTKVNITNQMIYEDKFFEYALWGVLLLIGSEFIRRFIFRESPV